MAQSRPLNPFLLSLWIIMIMLTLVFTILFLIRNKEVKSMVEGNAEDPQRAVAISEYEKRLNEKLAAVAAIERDIQIREEELYRLNTEASKRRIALDDAGNKIASANGEKLTYRGNDYQGKVTWWEVYRHYLGQAKLRLDSLLAEHESPDRTTVPKLEEAIQRRQTEMQKVLADAKEKDELFKADMERLAKQKDALEKEKAKTEKQRRADYGSRLTDIGQKEDKIRTLLELELRWLTTLEPDGEILEVLREQDEVIINLGRADNVFPGLLFEVFQDEKGKYLEKGKLEVIDVRSRIATCRILAENNQRKYPLAKGDKIGNAVFDSKSPRVFVLVGEFKRYNQEDLEGFIRATGGVVREKLVPGVHYLVAGDRSEKDRDAAREYPVLAMTEDQLLKYVQTTFATRAPGARQAVKPKPVVQAKPADAPAAPAPKAP